MSILRRGFEPGQCSNLGQSPPGIFELAIRASYPKGPGKRKAPARVTKKSSVSAQIVDLGSLPAVDCPCGVARRAFADRDEFPGTVHLTHIKKDAASHYHKSHTEVYVVLDCDPQAAIELDGCRHPLRPQTAVLIPPGVRHRACGEMTVLILCTPNFDSADEHFDLCD